MTTSSTQCLVIVIPARYASMRLTGKPSPDIMGKAMVQQVQERSFAVPDLYAVPAATDDAQVADLGVTLYQFGVKDKAAARRALIARGTGHVFATTAGYMAVMSKVDP